MIPEHLLVIAAIAAERYSASFESIQWNKEEGDMDLKWKVAGTMNARGSLAATPGGQLNSYASASLVSQCFFRQAYPVVPPAVAEIQFEFYASQCTRTIESKTSIRLQTWLNPAST